MLTDALPTCPFCGVNETPSMPAYRGGGGHFGGSLTQQGFTCTGALCGAFVQMLSHQGGTILVFIARYACSRRDSGTEPRDGEDNGIYTFPEAYSTWVDKVLLPTWRDRAAALEAFKNAEWYQWIDEQFTPAFPNSDYPRGKGTFYDLPDDAKAFITATWGETFRPGCYLPIPPELVAAVYPPRAPKIDGVYFMVPGLQLGAHGSDTRWIPLDHDHSASLVPPEDPILRNNYQFFADVWIEVARGIERDLPPITETKNEYGGIEPWYTFTLNGCTFTAGWRKRVVSITVEAPNGLKTEDIRTLAVADQVTYMAGGPRRLVLPDEFEAGLREKATPEQMSTVDTLVEDFRNTHPNGKVLQDFAWQDPREVAHLLQVHAWGKEKTIEYLTILCRTVLTEPA